MHHKNNSLTYIFSFNNSLSLIQQPQNLLCSLFHFSLKTIAHYHSFVNTILSFLCLRRPSRRRDLEPWCSCPAITEVTRKMGRKTSRGCLLCADRSGAETARRPGDVCSATTEAERRPWTHGRLLYHDRSHAEDGASEVRGTSCHEPTEPEARP